MRPGGGPVKMEAEIQGRVHRPRSARDCPSPPGLRREAGSGPPAALQRETPGLLTPASRLWGKTYTSLVSRHPAVVFCFSRRREHVHPPHDPWTGRNLSSLCRCSPCHGLAFLDHLAPRAWHRPGLTDDIAPSRLGSCCMGRGSGAGSHVPWGGGGVAGGAHSGGRADSGQAVPGVVPAAASVLACGCPGVPTEAGVAVEFQAWVSMPPSVLRMTQDVSVSERL